MSPSTTSSGKGPASSAKKSASKPKVGGKITSDKAFHPQSRKADQLARKAIRKGKIGNLASKRSTKRHVMRSIYNFFYEAIPEDGSALLEDELRYIIETVWLTKYDDELEEERAARRKGRPKSVKESKLEELKAKDVEEYRTGLEVPDMLSQDNVDLFRRWDQKETGFLQLMRFIRISSSSPEIIVSRKGTHKSLAMPSNKEDGMDLDDEEAPELLEHPEPSPLIPENSSSSVSSTIMGMDQSTL